MKLAKLITDISISDPIASHHMTKTKSAHNKQPFSNFRNGITTVYCPKKVLQENNNQLVFVGLNAHVHVPHLYFT